MSSALFTFNPLTTLAQEPAATGGVMGWLGPQFVVSMMVITIMLPVILIVVAWGILLERKIASWVQDRIGPNRVGPLGLLQPIADGLKFLLKEDYTPPKVDRFLFSLAPVLVIVPALIAWAVVPWGGFFRMADGTVVNVVVAPLNIGLIYLLAVGSLAVYGIVLAGYASNNKYSFLGGLRATAQMLSYEVPQGLSVLIIILTTGGLVATFDVVNVQANAVWNVFYHPVLALIFFLCVLAECNRAPFDIAEAEQELVGGYHTEYSSMRFALFFLGEYIHMITGAAFFVILFLGGWDLPIVREPLIADSLFWVVLKTLVFLAKIVLLLSLMMWIRWTLPRLRFDQLMKLAWRAMIPMTLAILLACSVLVYVRPEGVDPISWGFTFTAANLVVLLGAAVFSKLAPRDVASNHKVALAGSRFSPLNPAAHH